MTKMNLQKIKKNKGFVILFAVTISSLILAIALGIASIAQKEVKFATSGRDANEAFLAADAGNEYALYSDKPGIAFFPPPGPYNFVVSQLGATGQACTKVTVDKTSPTLAVITSKGYNTGGGTASVCNPTSNSIERELRTTYAYSLGSSTPAIISPVRQSTGSATSGTVISVTITSPTAGNALILTYGGNPNTATIASVAGGGVTWVKAKSSNTNRDAEIWYGLNASGLSTNVTITLNSALGGSGGLANVSEWSGLSGSSVVDASGSASGTSASITTATINTTNANDLIITIGRHASSSSLGNLSPFISLASPDSAAFQAAYAIVSSTGSYYGGWTLSSSVAWEAEIAAFKGI
jgi:hypothetical protein